MKRAITRGIVSVAGLTLICVLGCSQQDGDTADAPEVPGTNSVETESTVVSEPEPQDSPVVVESTVVVDVAARDCLADAIYHEAKNTGAVGLQAVGHVVMNRADDPRFPSSVCGVVREGEERGRCQFSFRCDGIAETYPDRAAHQRALALAEKFLQKRPRDITGGALFFHADWARPNAFFRSRPKVGKFGGNVFYL